MDEEADGELLAAAEQLAQTGARVDVREYVAA
jgi:hypothetical protein